MTATLDVGQPAPTGTDGMELFVAFPDKRKASEPLSPLELQRMEDLIIAYMKHPSKRARPSKAQLSAVTSSLFEDGARKLSPQWNKTQLGAAIMHWLDVAKSLPESKDQLRTYLQVSTHKDAPNLMDHQITSTEDSGETSTMSISSPSTRAKGKPVPVVLSPQIMSEDVEDENEVEVEAVPIFDESPSTFLEQFERLLGDPELALTPGPNPRGVTAPRNVPKSAELAPIPELGNGRSFPLPDCKGLNTLFVRALEGHER